MLPKHNTHLVNLQKGLPIEFRSWLWFDKHIVRNESIGVLLKESIEWKTLLVTEDILPAYVKSNRQKRARFLSQLLLFWKECFDPSNPWQLCIEEGNVKVMIRKNCSWKSFRQSLHQYARAFIVSSENFTTLKGLGINSSFDNFSSTSKVIPFGICGYFNHKCGHSCQFAVDTKGRKVGNIVPVLINWYLDDSKITSEDDKVLDENYDQNKAGPPLLKGNEFFVNYGRNLWFLCHCGEPACLHGEHEKIVIKQKTKRKRASEENEEQKHVEKSLTKIRKKKSL